MKGLHRLKDKLHSLTRFPYEKEYREQLELEVISLDYRFERTIALAILLLQIVMLCIFLFRPGNSGFSYRRLHYVITYSALALGLFVLLPFHNRSKENWRLHSRVSIVFGILISLWVVSISYLDALGGGSIIVYCAVLPIMSAVLIVPPHILSILFFSTCVLTNCLVLSTPFGQKNVFNVLINSIFICLLSILYAYRAFRTRLSSAYDKMIIEEKNKQLEEANKDLKLISMTDRLTALGNRRYLEESISLRLEKCGEHMGSLTVIFLDIDFFKLYNDRYGHQQGDIYLRAVASVLASFAQDNGFHAVRFGGEEFMLVMTGLSQNAALEKAEQLRKAIAAMKIPNFHGEETAVTISVGVSFHEIWEPNLLETAISEADQALYQAKQNGRNQTVMFSK